MAISISADSSSVVPGQVYIFGLDLLRRGGSSKPRPERGATTADAASSAAISGHAADVTGAGGSFRTDIVLRIGLLSNAGAVYVYPNYNEGPSPLGPTTAGAATSAAASARARWRPLVSVTTTAVAYMHEP